MEKGWTKILELGKEYRAEIAKEKLENEGINSVIIDQSDSSFPDVGNAEVFVKDEDVEKALIIVKELKN